MKQCIRKASWFISLLGVGLVTQTACVMAQDIGDASDGRRLAETWCANCHVVTPDAQAGTSNGAPTFVAVAHMKSVTPMSLRVFLQTPHNRMPDLRLTRDQIDNVIAYIFSLRDK